MSWWLPLVVSLAQSAPLAEWVPMGGGISAPAEGGGTQVPGTPLHVDVVTRDLHSRSAAFSSGSRLPHGHAHDGSSPNVDEYVQFSVVSAKGIAFTTVSYDRRAYGDDGAEQASIRWSVDGFAADLDTQPIDPTDRTADVVFDLSA
jgi:hypothetical protein